MELTLILIIVIIICSLAIALLVSLLFKRSKRVRFLSNNVNILNEKYSGIIDVDRVVEEKTSQFQIEEQEFKRRIDETRKSLEVLKEKYESANKIFENLTAENNLLKDSLNIAEFGVYEPHFELDSSEEYREKLLENKGIQKNFIKEELAVKCYTDWTVNNSLKKGEVKTKRAIKLTIRAFNGECDALIAKVKWNNIEQSEKRIERTFDAINKLNKSNDIHIQRKFFDLKIEELRITHEYHQKKHEEKEEQRRIREQMREEEKAQRDFEKALKEAEKEEKLLQKAMKKAHEQIAKATEQERVKYELELAEMREKLQLAEEKSARAISMAQQTKSGHVYVISNIGSFGENVYKIGMTRRLEPLDRVYELGGASVPFRFDVHAMIYSDNAPELENKLHKEFSSKRLNCVNLRREYFDITLEEIEKVVLENNDEIEFVKVPEAKEYRESLIIKQELQKSNTDINESKFPSTEQLFG